MAQVVCQSLDQSKNKTKTHWLTHIDGAATAPRADERLIFRAYSFTLNFASTIEVPAIVDLDLDMDSFGAPLTPIFVAGSDITVNKSPTNFRMSWKKTKLEDLWGDLFSVTRIAYGANGDNGDREPSAR